jgi:flavin-dependent dehydrogenase
MFSNQMGHALRERLQEAVFDRATFASVAGISLQRTKSAGVRECRIGDSICMIPPMTGNGMSIALESAMIAAPILREYSRGGIEWNKAQEEVSRQCDRTFDRRLAFAGFLQRVCQREAGRRLLLATTRSVPRSFQGWFWLTR